MTVRRESMSERKRGEVPADLEAEAITEEETTTEVTISRVITETRTSSREAEAPTSITEKIGMTEIKGKEAFRTGDSSDHLLKRGSETESRETDIKKGSLIITSRTIKAESLTERERKEMKEGLEDRSEESNSITNSETSMRVWRRETGMETTGLITKRGEEDMTDLITLEATSEEGEAEALETEEETSGKTTSTRSRFQRDTRLTRTK